jgi:hypothetical protein
MPGEEKPKIAVGVLCGRGETDEALKVIQGCLGDSHVHTVLPLFPHATTRIQGKYLFFPPAADNRRGAARTQLIRVLARLQDTDICVLLDDDTLPGEDYFKMLAALLAHPAPTLFTGRLLNADGERNWDVCSFQNGRPVVVPYDFVDHPMWTADLYFSGPQHIFNKPGAALAAKIGYPDLSYGEDTHFCRVFRENGGELVFIPEISAKLLHQHNPPNLPELVW